ncbi:MAG TPA: ribosome maturation factor [Agriterribacter sp.]|uniref:ribosome maturation factor RimP n=1 Tax=Agriterribacter sp. TaxID=2821509 RepID=UPI002C90E904|nr:ribosome maturation factor [Agriterribacter sp.]HRP58066.1 ribosome maturation factor [Agriterribacter sp.]HRQ19250.1 ribosome maturation factor [Agriterribacter sp.]
MSSEATTGAITQMMTTLLEDNPDYFLVEIKINPTNNVKVFLDADGGVSIDKCVKYNRVLYKQIEESGIFPDGNFSLEVSSPGLDEPLKLIRQYIKNTGRNVEVLLHDGGKIEGKLKVVSDVTIQVEEVKGKNKKQEVLEHTIPIDNIKTTKIQIQF